MQERLVELLKLAIRKEVSDFHFTLKRNHLEIEMRSKGVMKKVKTKTDDEKMISYLKYRANLDMGESMKPQSGAFVQIVGQHHLSLRFSCVSSFLQTSGVLRILNVKSNLQLSDITNESDYILLNEMINKRSGLILFCGPTGSGKTTSLYTLLQQVKQKKIFSLEDPIEIIQENMVQLQINDKAGFGYDEGIRQLLRQDPDIIMIGEIRGKTEAQMAIRAALTGHLVVSSIHASSVPQCLQRLLELDVSSSQIEDVILAIINQRIYSSKVKNGKEVVMEIANSQQIIKYLNTGEFFNENSLSKQIEALVEMERIDSNQAKQDI